MNWISPCFDEREVSSFFLIPDSNKEPVLYSIFPIQSRIWKRNQSLFPFPYSKTISFFTIREYICTHVPSTSYSWGDTLFLPELPEVLNFHIRQITELETFKIWKRKEICINRLRNQLLHLKRFFLASKQADKKVWRQKRLHTHFISRNILGTDLREIFWARTWEKQDGRGRNRNSLGTDLREIGWTRT